MALLTPSSKACLAILSSRAVPAGTRGIGTFVACSWLGGLAVRSILGSHLHRPVLATSSLWMVVGWTSTSRQHDRDQLGSARAGAGFHLRSAQHDRLREPSGRITNRRRGALDADPQHRLGCRYFGRHRPVDEHDDHVSQPACRACHAVQRLYECRTPRGCGSWHSALACSKLVTQQAAMLAYSTTSCS